MRVGCVHAMGCMQCPWRAVHAAHACRCAQRKRHAHFAPPACTNHPACTSHPASTQSSTQSSTHRPPTHPAIHPPTHLEEQGDAVGKAVDVDARLDVFAAHAHRRLRTAGAARRGVASAQRAQRGTSAAAAGELPPAGVWPAHVVLANPLGRPSTRPAGRPSSPAPAPPHLHYERVPLVHPRLQLVCGHHLRPQLLHHSQPQVVLACARVCVCVCVGVGAPGAGRGREGGGRGRARGGHGACSWASYGWQSSRQVVEAALMERGAGGRSSAARRAVQGSSTARQLRSRGWLRFWPGSPAGLRCEPSGSGNLTSCSSWCRRTTCRARNRICNACCFLVESMLPFWNTNVHACLHASWWASHCCLHCMGGQG